MTTTRLTRDLDEAMLGGVLAGIAAQYRWDPTLLRIVAALVTIATGVIPGGLIYLGAWLVIPRPESTLSGPSAETATEDVPTAESVPPNPVTNEIAETLRDTADRLSEAAAIAAEAARRAANEIGEVARRPRGVAAEDQPTPGMAVEDRPTAAAAPDEPARERSKPPESANAPAADDSADGATGRAPSA